MPLNQKPRPQLVLLTAPGIEDPHNLEAIAQRADIVRAHAPDLGHALAGADALLMWDFFSSALADAWDGADALRWVHVAAAGVDAMLFDEMAESPVTLTNAHGVFDGPIAEFVLASIMAQDKMLHANKSLQRAGIWKHREPTRTAGSRVIVVGTGGIGRATARLLRAVGMEVAGAGRTARESDPDFGTVFASSELAAHVGAADHVVLAAPLTEATRGLINAGVLAAMKNSAHLVNIGRGALVDEPALVEALRTGQIAAASLDVVAVEPLGEGHPFWTMENVHISAHLSGDVDGWRDALADQFLANLDAYISGDPLANIVDKDRGYVSSAAV